MHKTSEHNEPLPQCEGAKLHPFRHCEAPIRFERLLSDTTLTNSVGNGGHAHVFEASIGSDTYALKIISKPFSLVIVRFASNAHTFGAQKFKFFDDEEVRAGEAERIPIDLLHAHMDSFYNECRVFGRPNEQKLTFAAVDIRQIEDSKSSGNSTRTLVVLTRNMTFPYQRDSHFKQSPKSSFKTIFH